jgi:hypothetical protein
MSKGIKRLTHHFFKSNKYRSQKKEKEKKAQNKEANQKSRDGSETSKRRRSVCEINHHIQNKRTQC